MTTLADLEAQLATLREVRFTGAKSVQYADGRGTEFRSDAELASAIADIERRIAAAKGARVTTVRLHTSKGI